MESRAQIQSLVFSVSEILADRGQTVCTVESCTGGGIACALTNLAGSSAWFEFGFVTYSNEAKTKLVGVEQTLFDSVGAVSRDVALAMASGGRSRSGADYSVSVTGIAGPGGGSSEKPVGTVWFGWAGPDFDDAEHQLFSGDRSSIRDQSVQFALAGLLQRLK